MLVGQRLRELREARGLSQENFSLAAGIGRSYYGGIERGLRNVAALNLIRIAQALDAEIGDLFPPTRDFKPDPPKAKAQRAKSK